MRLARVVLAIALGVASGAALAQIYRWTDRDGRVHMSDTPPPAGATNVQKRNPPGAGAAARANEPYALQVARKNYPVTLYTSLGCDPCVEARKLLNARGVPFREVSVSNQQQLEELKKVAGNASVPVMLVGSSLQRGFEEGAYHAMLDGAGYPKAGILPPRSQPDPGQPQPQSESESESPLAAEEETPRGPYAPGAPPQRSRRR
jgi:glutaredoxin